jgi:hypothetical protein
MCKSKADAEGNAEIALHVAFARMWCERESLEGTRGAGMTTMSCWSSSCGNVCGNSQGRIGRHSTRASVNHKNK